MDYERLKKLSPEELRIELQNLTLTERLAFTAHVSEQLETEMVKAFPQAAAHVQRGQSVSQVDWEKVAKDEIERIRRMR